MNLDTQLEEDDLRRLTYRNGPSVVVIGTNDGFRDFYGSIFNEECPTNYDHAVLLLGWDEKHWIIQNSWGENFGKDGRILLPRGQNKCGVQTMVASVLM